MSICSIYDDSNFKSNKEKHDFQDVIGSRFQNHVKIDLSNQALRREATTSAAVEPRVALTTELLRAFRERQTKRAAGSAKNLISLKMRNISPLSEKNGE